MKINTKALYVPLFILVCILLIRILFPYPVYIEDALTLERLPQYDIHVSLWRILFEPVLGVLLFFNRALYSLSEFPVVLYWVLGLFVLYSMIRAVGISDGLVRKRFLFQQLAYLPVIAGLWFVVFVLIVFIPLPNNTIVNNDPGTVLVNTHAHSEYSHDGLMPQKALWRWHRRNGFDAFFITDHNNHNKTLDFVQAQRNGAFSADPLVMCGEEFSGSNHLSLLGLKRQFSTRGYADSTVVDSVRANGGAVIVNHWFDDKNMSLAYYRDLGVDGFEIENTATDRWYDRKLYQEIKEFCVENGLLMNGGVDFHGYGNACSLWNALEVSKWHAMDQDGKAAAIVDLLRSRDQSRLKVLRYRDRPYYGADALWISPLRTFLQYFRTLNVFQLLSWAVWLFAMAYLLRTLLSQPGVAKWMSYSRLLPAAALIGSVFLISLGLAYYVQHRPVEGFTEIYAEYSQLLLYAGFGFLTYSVLLFYFRIVRPVN